MYLCERTTKLALKILPNASKMARAGQRVDTSFSSHYSVVKSDENVDPAKLGRLWSAFPHLGVWVPCWCGVGWPCPGVLALLVTGFVRWVSI